MQGTTRQMEIKMTGTRDVELRYQPNDQFPDLLLSSFFGLISGWRGGTP
jgi:hypothetical protein